MGRPKEHGEATRQELLSAAERLLGAGKLDRVAVRAVAEEAGVTTRAIYSLFGGREGLIHALYRRAFTGLTQTLDTVPLTHDPGSDLVNLALDGFRRYALEHPNMFRLAFEELIPGMAPEPEDVEAAMTALGRLKQRVQRAADAGLIGDREILQVAYQWHIICKGLASTELSGRLARWTSDPTRFWEDTLRTFLAGIAAGTRP